MPGMPGIAATGSASVAAVQPEPSSGAVDEASVAGAAEDQPAGTDRPPTVEASAMPADIPPPTLFTRAPSPMAAPPASGTTSLAVAAGVAAARVCPSDTPVGMAFIVNHAPVLTAPLSALNTAGVPRRPSRLVRVFPRPSACAAFHRLVPMAPPPNRFVRLLRLPPSPDAAGAAVAFAKAAETAVDCMPAAAGLAVGAAGTSGCRTPEAAEAAEYVYIAIASWTHISAYSASVAMIAGVLMPRKFVATSAASNDLLAAISGGGTVAANAAS